MDGKTEDRQTVIASAVDARETRRSAELAVDELQPDVLGNISNKSTAANGQKGRSDGEIDKVAHVCENVREEPKYDWEAEANKPAKEKGFQRRGEWPNYDFRIREMVWERRDGCWCGTWAWTEWKATKVWEKQVRARQERVIRAWDATDVPQEALLLAIECIVGSSLSISREIIEAAKARRNHYIPGLHVGSLALVCRSWYALIAPTLYSKLEIGYDGILRHPLRQSVARHARRISVHSGRPLMTTARISYLIPRPSPAVWLHCEGAPSGSSRDIGKDTCAPYHPSHAVSYYSLLHSSYPSVTKLRLSTCTFLSSSDLLRVLASFSALEVVELDNIVVAHVSEFAARPGQQASSHLREIYIQEDCKPRRLPFVTQWWTWPRKPCYQKLTASRGLLPAEHQLASHINALAMQQDDTWYYVDAIINDGETWVAWSMGLLGSFQVEFHASQDDSHQRGAARIHGCLLRVRDKDATQKLADNLKVIGDIFAQFAFLETIVLETAYPPEVDDPILQSLIARLCDVSTAEVCQRTCDEAHELALHAKKSTAHSSSALLLSPFWCLRDHAREWKSWLSKEYWNGLAADGKTG